MPWYRTYVDKKITAKGGGEHSRVVDLAATDANAAREQVSAMLKKDEEIGQTNELSFGDPDNPTAAAQPASPDELIAFYKQQLADLGVEVAD